MKATPNAEKFIYLLIILLALAVLVMVAISPSNFLNTGAVYQGF
jgi:hypothetical protein